VACAPTSLPNWPPVTPWKEVVIGTLPPTPPEANSSAGAVDPDEPGAPGFPVGPAGPAGPAFPFSDARAAVDSRSAPSVPFLTLQVGDDAILQLRRLRDRDGGERRPATDGDREGERRDHVRVREPFPVHQLT
jgi:hypothetical protein